MNQSQIRQEIARSIIEALEKDQIPWVRPWSLSKNAGHPANFVSGKSYRGINPLLLDLHARRHGFQSRWWGTYNQIKAAGGDVQRRPSDLAPGQWGAKVIFFAPVKKTVVSQDTGEEENDKFLVMRTYTVFNADQTTGSALDQFRSSDEPAGNPEWADFGPAEELIQAIGVRIEHGGDKAFYRRPEPFDLWPFHTDGDYIVVPNKERFHTLPDYYATVFHELAHAAEIRTGWDHRKKGYELGELAAEIASCFTGSELGLPPGDLTNHARYVRHWIEAMKGDSSYVLKAATQASKVTDYLLGFVKKEQGEPAAA